MPIVVNMKFPEPSPIKRLSSYLTISLVVIFFVSALFVLSQNDGETRVISGIAFASDGDSLQMNGLQIRLLGVDAPEFDQTCLHENRSVWSCGRASRDWLSNKIAGRTIQCTGTHHDQYGRLLATCTIGGRDIGSDLVREGLALSYGAYQTEETMAKIAGSGMWSGTFTQPRDWREGRRHPPENSEPLNDLFR